MSLCLDVLAVLEFVGGQTGRLKLLLLNLLANWHIDSSDGILVFYGPKFNDGDLQNVW